jgi:hypothetical protein
VIDCHFKHYWTFESNILAHTFYKIEIAKGRNPSSKILHKNSPKTNPTKWHFITPLVLFLNIFGILWHERKNFYLTPIPQMKAETLFTFNYLTLRLVLSLNNILKIVKWIFVKIWSWHVQNHHNYHRLHSK